MDSSDNLSSPSNRVQHWPQLLATIFSILLYVSAGIHFAWILPASLRWDELQFYISETQDEVFIILSFAGYFIGCPVTAFLLNKIGRKYSIIILAGPQILACVLIANTIHVFMIYVARLLSGFSEGGVITAIPIYIAEISHPEVRGALGMSPDVAFMIGHLVINITGSFLSITKSAYASLLVPALFLITFIWMPESPYFYIMKDKMKSARKSLRQLRWMDNVEPELNQLTLDVQRQMSEPSSIKNIFTIKSNLKAFFMLLGVRMLQQLSGGESLHLYHIAVFKEVSRSTMALLSTVLFYLSVLLVSCCSLLIVDEFGRKKLLIISVIGTGIFVLVIALYYHYSYYRYDITFLLWIPTTFLRFSTIIRALGLTNIPSLLSGELFSLSVKVKALCLVNMIYASSIIIWRLTLKPVRNSCGLHVPLYLCAFTCVMGAWFVYYCLPETKQKTLEEIQQQLKGKRTEQINSETT